MKYSEFYKWLTSHTWDEPVDKSEGVFLDYLGYSANDLFDEDSGTFRGLESRWLTLAEEGEFGFIIKRDTEEILQLDIHLNNLHIRDIIDIVSETNLYNRRFDDYYNDPVLIVMGHSLTENVLGWIELWIDNLVKYKGLMHRNLGQLYKFFFENIGPLFEYNVKFEEDESTEEGFPIIYAYRDDVSIGFKLDYITGSIIPLDVESHNLFWDTSTELQQFKVDLIEDDSSYIDLFTDVL
jgi:hypothetical protein